MQNLVWTRLAPISNPQKRKSKKLVCSFPFVLFHFETNLIKLRSSRFSRPFWTAGKFLQSWSDTIISWFRQKFFLLSNLIPRVPSFYVQTKFRLKNWITIVHLLQCKTNFFIHLCFLGRNVRQIKEHSSWEASINV